MFSSVSSFSPCPNFALHTQQQQPILQIQQRCMTIFKTRCTWYALPAFGLVIFVVLWLVHQLDIGLPTHSDLVPSGLGIRAYFCFFYHLTVRDRLIVDFSGISVFARDGMVCHIPYYRFLACLYYGACLTCACGFFHRDILSAGFTGLVMGLSLIHI